jgi:6-pyruvoyltetrahydropterin/6-carboxytetrahydropterin synthase
MNAANFWSTKRFTGFPCTHRQWRSDAHCKFVHGYSREFYFEFACSTLSPEGWVVDFGGLKSVKTWLDHMFDHTFLASDDDPFMQTFRELDLQGVIQLRTFANVGMEGTAEHVYEHVNAMIQELTGGRAWLTLVEVRENEKNSAIYRPVATRGER